MALSTYNKDLLEFMYNLTFTPKIRPPLDISKFLELRGQKVSERTIKRWFMYLGNNIAYHARINYASLNLQTVYVLLKEAHPKLLTTIPYSVVPFYGYDATNLIKYTGTHFPIPIGKEKELEEFLTNAKELNLLQDFELFPYNQVADSYLPFHEVIDLEGNFKFNQTYDISHFEALFDYAVRKPSEQKLSKIVEKNPITLPIIVEYSRKRWSSHKVWFAMNENLEDNLWNYIKRKKSKIRERQGAGVALVQKSVRDIQLAHDELFRQVRVFYGPFNDDKNVVANIFIKLKNHEQIKELFKEIAQKAIITSFYLPTDLSNKLRIALTTNIESQTKISNEILPKYIDNDYDNKVIFRRKQNKEINMKLNYSKLFNPKTCEWEFDLEKYKENLTHLYP